MRAAKILASAVLLSGLLVSATASATCVHMDLRFTEGEQFCKAGNLFQCGASGVWKKLPSSCQVKVDPRQEKPAASEKNSEKKNNAPSN